LAIHEVATNALKYGALSRAGGRIEVSWRIDEAASPPQLIFDWTEQGGPKVAAPQRKGFGTELLERTMAFELKGSTVLTFDPAGVRCVVTVPLSRRIIHTPSVGT
jgi:two-component system CheB/CheR fusion protein